MLGTSCLFVWFSAAFAREIDVVPHDMTAPQATSFLEGRSEVYVSTAQAYCEKNFWLSLTTCTKPLDDGTTFVLTGDIPAMWIRDSSAQMSPYITVAQKQGQHSKLRPLLEGTLRRQAQFMLTDPYANAFTMDWDSAYDERLKRGAYVFTGNYELDDGPYFFRFLARLQQAFPDTAVLHEKPIKDATRTMIALYRQEQQHAAGESEYLYPKWRPWELPQGHGRPVKYTGMVWGAFRPSDDPQEYGYNIPGNLFLAATLEPIVHIATSIWQDQDLADSALELRESIIKGAHRFGTKHHNGKLVYCYEVDGLGNCKLMDDANIPSLLSLPYLDPNETAFDKAVYKSTREFILSTENPWYFEGRAGRGIGSPHTGHRRIWPLSLVMQAMTSERDAEKMEMLQLLDQSGVFHQGLTESFHADDAGDITRPWFGWPNSLLAELMMAENRCQPSLSELPNLIPPTEKAPRLQTWQQNESFYTMSPKRLMRRDVTLPKAKFFPSRNLHVRATRPLREQYVQAPGPLPRGKDAGFHSLESKLRTPEEQNRTFRVRGAKEAAMREKVVAPPNTKSLPLHKHNSTFGVRGAKDERINLHNQLPGTLSSSYSPSSHFYIVAFISFFFVSLLLILLLILVRTSPVRLVWRLPQRAGSIKS